MATRKRSTSNIPINYAEQLAKESAGIAEQISAPSGNRIKIRPGRGFTLPTGEDVDALECVIVDFMTYNAYYDRPYNKDDISPPACFSITDTPATAVPHKSSPDMQANSCAGCQQNQFGSAVIGAGKACRNSRLLAVMPVDAMDDPDSAEFWTLSVPPKSLKAFDVFVSGLANRHKTIPVGVLAQIETDPKVDYAVLAFALSRPLDAKTELGFFFQQRDAARALLETPPDVTQYSPPKASRPVQRGKR